MDNVGRVLDRAADIIEENGWCQGELARTLDGEGCFPNDPRAASFCIEGAVKLASDGDGMLQFNAFHRMKRALSESPADWNDRASMTKGRVIRNLRMMARSEA